MSITGEIPPNQHTTSKHVFSQLHSTWHPDAPYRTEIHQRTEDITELTTHLNTVADTKNLWDSSTEGEFSEKIRHDFTTHTEAVQEHITGLTNYTKFINHYLHNKNTVLRPNVNLIDTVIFELHEKVSRCANDHRMPRNITAGLFAVRDHLLEVGKQLCAHQETQFLTWWDHQKTVLDHYYSPDASATQAVSDSTLAARDHLLHVLNPDQVQHMINEHSENMGSYRQLWDDKTREDINS